MSSVQLFPPCLKVFPVMDLPPPFTPDGAAVHGPEGPRQCSVDCGAGSGGEERSQHQVRDHYFLTYTRLVHSCVCVPFRGCPVLGLRPGVGHERRTPPRHLAGGKIKTQYISPPLDEIVHCMMTIGAALSLFSLSFCSPLSGLGPVLLPAGPVHDF